MNKFGTAKTQRAVGFILSFSCENPQVDEPLRVSMFLERNQRPVLASFIREQLDRSIFIQSERRLAACLRKTVDLVALVILRLPTRRFFVNAAKSSPSQVAV
jgi:hypothetical protein